MQFIIRVSSELSQEIFGLKVFTEYIPINKFRKSKTAQLFVCNRYTGFLAWMECSFTVHQPKFTL